MCYRRTANRIFNRVRFLTFLQNLANFGPQTANCRPWHCLCPTLLYVSLCLCCFCDWWTWVYLYVIVGKWAEHWKMYAKLVAIFLPLLLLEVIPPVTPLQVSRQVVASYKKLRTTQNGHVRCALDTANDTSSLSSLEHCSLNCGRDDTCSGFNMKNSTTCDVYNYNPKINGPVSGCTFYQVDNL